MRVDYVELLEGSKSVNLSFPVSTTAPSLPNPGEVYFNNSVGGNHGLYFFNNLGAWIKSEIYAINTGLGISDIDWARVINEPTTLSGYGITGGTFSASVEVQGALTLAGDPASAGHVASKRYVDNVALGVAWKASCLVATTGNITLSGLQTIDGVSVLSGTRVLVRAQTDAAQNGIYVASSGAWTRSTDFDSLSPIDEINGAAVYVVLGSTQASYGYTVGTTVATLGTDPIDWIQIFGVDLNNIALQGVPTTPTAASNNNSTQIASTAYVDRYSFYELAFGVEGYPTHDEVIWKFDVPRAMRIPAAFTGSYGKCAGLAAYETILTFKKNGTAVGTITFPSQTVSGTFATLAGEISLAAGDILTLVNQTYADANFGDFQVNVVAYEY